MTPVLMPPHHVLLVEDDQFDVELARLAWAESALSGEPEVVRDGQDALNYLRREGQYHSRVAGEPRLVLLDLNMPRVSGLELLGALKRDPELRHLPVVVFTTSDERRDREACAALGADDYLIKPSNFERFVGLLNDLAARWLGPDARRPDTLRPSI